MSGGAIGIGGGVSPPRLLLLLCMQDGAAAAPLDPFVVPKVPVSVLPAVCGIGQFRASDSEALVWRSPRGCSDLAPLPDLRRVGGI